LSAVKTEERQVARALHEQRGPPVKEVARRVGVSQALASVSLRVVVSNTSVVQSIYGAIQEYGGFDRPDRLD
jgi:hypothetical protein